MPFGSESMSDETTVVDVHALRSLVTNAFRQ